MPLQPCTFVARRLVGTKSLGRRTYTAASEQYARESSVPRRIHVYGVGNVGKLIAHSLRADKTPVTLLFHRPHLLKLWNQSDQTIVLESDGHRVPRSGFDADLVLPPRRSHGAPLESDDHDPLDADDQEPIDNLIFTGKAPFTLSALHAVKHRLRPESTVCLLQNGMGIIDQVNQEIFPDPVTRPNYIQGVVTHGLNSPDPDNPFFAVHAAHGTIALAALPRGDLKDNPSDSVPFAPTARYLLRTLTGSPVLAAVGFPPLEFMQQQLEKLAINAVINPLTVMLDAPNGSILYNFAITRTMRLLLAEISLVIRSLPELRGLPNIQDRFSPERLETLVVSIANKTGENISSMLADVRAGRKTEVRYINGYIVRRGEEMGMQCVCNYMMMQLVEGKTNMIQRENLDQVPVVREDLNAHHT
ncbi:6-phosphogluconate dehydrogenase C-terminal domain-like protein [Aureobasidium sp. EXF-10728]|nr:6-phosphogluconate dehydrogenase C-terminal domain-like protein [Aureobasidium sp. EXF-10728]